MRRGKKRIEWERKKRMRVREARDAGRNKGNRNEKELGAVKFNQNGRGEGRISGRVELLIRPVVDQNQRLDCHLSTATFNLIFHIMLMNNHTTIEIPSEKFAQHLFPSLD